MSDLIYLKFKIKGYVNKFNVIKKLVKKKYTPSSFWEKYTVTLHKRFHSAKESLEYFEWRNSIYINYIDYMPVKGFDNKVVLDFGCGPGNDLVGFGAYSNPSKLIGMDFSNQALAEARERLKLHNKINPDLLKINSESDKLPLDDNSIDHIHSSGVLHHLEDPSLILREFYRILKPGGTANIMIYNYDSIFYHLFINYVRAVVEGLYPSLTLDEIFKISTDTEDCPVSRCYKFESWVRLCNEAGFETKITGVAISAFELNLLNLRFKAIQDIRVSKESREFLLNLRFDERGYPLYNHFLAGIDACYNLKKL